ncbi:MAG: hypothetical protein GY816_19190, partial [Cytophagales bacterium]|nr:hypothetical protein [Cytophagales bacterium]
MAKKLKAWFVDDFDMDENLMQDVAALERAQRSGDMTQFALYAGTNFDSSADYWKLTDNGKIEYDGKANLYDERGNLVLRVVEELSLEEDQQGSGKYAETGLARILGIGNQEAALLMASKGLDYTVADGKDTLDTNNWSWRKNGMNEINKMIPGFDAPTDMLFLLGSQNQYSVLAERGLMTKEPSETLFGLAGKLGFEQDISYDDWMSNRVNSDIFDRINLDYPAGTMAPWSDALLGDGLKTCTQTSAYRNSNVLADIMGSSFDDVTTEMKESGLWSPLYGIANGSKFSNIPSELAGNDFGTVLSMMGLADGVKRYSAIDINAGDLNEGAILTIWHEDNYAQIFNGEWPTNLPYGHTGSNGGVNIEGFGTEQMRVTVSWVDQYNGSDLHDWNFYTDSSEEY